MVRLPAPGVVRNHLASRYGRLAQLAVSLALLAWIVISLDSQTWSAIPNVGAMTLGFAVVLFASAQLFGGIRLALLLPGASFWRVAILATWVGYFWGNFLPGTVGGDVVRGSRLHRAGIGLSMTVGALLLDRLLNLCAVALILATGAVSLGGRLTQGTASAAAVAVGMLIIGGVAVSFRLALANARLRPLVTQLVEPLRIVGCSPSRLAGVTLMSFLSLGAAIVAQWLIARRLGLGIDLAQLATIICAVTIFVLLPVSLNGLGLQEASFVVLLTSAGAPAGLALSFSLLARTLIVGAGAIAGAIVVADRIAATRGSRPA